MSFFKNLSNVFNGNLVREIEYWKLINASWEENADKKDKEIQRLKVENVVLKLRLSQSHMRDPKTGRIMPKGKHIA